MKTNCFNVENGDISATALKRAHKKRKLCRKCGKCKDTVLYSGQRIRRPGTLPFSVEPELFLKFSRSRAEMSGVTFFVTHK